MADLVRVRDLLPGDEVTELDTPDGPWFRVVAVEAGTGTVTVEVEPGLTVVVAVGCWETVAVLRRVPVPEAELRAGAHPLTPGA